MQKLFKRDYAAPLWMRHGTRRGRCRREGEVRWPTMRLCDPATIEARLCPLAPALLHVCREGRLCRLVLRGRTGFPLALPPPARMRGGGTMPVYCQQTKSLRRGAASLPPAASLSTLLPPSTTEERGYHDSSLSGCMRY
ncbi:hypothetical protein K523DRAFT_422224 [Schizophyllum commune Tattone D]|nr:hypothetical protein K523DRAFT_422224 [Schizophyllum commune Tattone D]